MGARHKARKRALDILFEADQRGEPIGVVLSGRADRGEGPGNAYTETLVLGVVEHADEIDALIEANAIDWSLDRMPAVDRACSDWPPTSFAGGLKSHLRWRSTRPSSWPRSFRQTNRRGSSTASWGGSLTGQDPA